MLSFFLAMAMATSERPALPGAAPCPAATRQKLLTPAKPGEGAFPLNCSITLKRGENIARPILIEGEQASGVHLDCNGGKLTPGAARINVRMPTLAIWSRMAGPGRWSRPEQVLVERCAILGAVHIYGVGAGQKVEQLVDASRKADFTKVAQTAAPINVTIRDSRLTAINNIPLYVGPGVTRFSLLDSRIDGKGTLAIYLDHEGGWNRIEGNDIDFEPRREMIAIDGSAHNSIRGNHIVLRGKAAAQIYRNCGERSVIRHQAPTDNIVTGNDFDYIGAQPRVLVGQNARKGRSPVCGDDAGYPFGSSIDDMDHAERNQIDGNRVRARR